MKNNRFVAPILIMSALISCSKKNYDLIAVDIHAERTEVRVGDRVPFSYSYNNEGADTVPPLSYTVRIYVDGKLYHEQKPAPKISPRGTISFDEKHVIDGLYVPLKAGKMIVKLVLNEDRDLHEIDYNNNKCEFELNVFN